MTLEGGQIAQKGRTEHSWDLPHRNSRPPSNYYYSHEKSEFKAAQNFSIVENHNYVLKTCWAEKVEGYHLIGLVQHIRHFPDQISVWPFKLQFIADWKGFLAYKLFWRKLVFLNVALQVPVSAQEFSADFKVYKNSGNSESGFMAKTKAKLRNYHPPTESPL